MSWFIVYIFVLYSLSRVQAADVNYMTKCIRNYFSDNRNHNENVTYKMAAMKFIFNEFQTFGIQTVYHNFTTPRFNGSFYNVVGILKGSNFGRADDKIIGIGAHYDTVQNTKGVNNNGAGVAAMLEVARQLTQPTLEGTPRKHTILFVSFDLEEYALIGSKAFISSWLSPWVSTNYGLPLASLPFQGMVIMDVMMNYNASNNSQSLPARTQQHFPEVYGNVAKDNYRGDFLALIYRNKTTDNALATTLESSWAAETRPLFELESFHLPFTNVSSELATNFSLYMRSDHRSFWNADIPAIFLTDMALYRGAMKQCYHKPCDDLDTMLTNDNINFLGKTADAVAKTMHELTVYSAYEQYQAGYFGDLWSYLFMDDLF